MSRYWSAVVHGLTPYVPGEQPKLANLVKLNTNENPYAPSPKVLDAIREAPVEVPMGEGRDRDERKLNLSIPQGKFLFHLPFPTAEPLCIAEIMKKAGVGNTNIPEIVDIVHVLMELRVIESA